MKQQGMAMGFKGTAMQMLLTCGINTTSAQKVQNTFFNYDQQYTEPWFDAHKLRIENAMTNVVGVPDSSNLLLRTIELFTEQDKVYREIGILRVLLKNKFGNKPELLYKINHDLGYNEFFERARKGNQAAILSLVMRISTVTTPTGTLYPLLVEEAKINPGIFSRMAASAPLLRELNQTQEQAKTETEANNKADREELLAIYNDTIKFCKLGYRIFFEDEVKRKEFSYTYVLNRMRGGQPLADDEDEPDEATDGDAA